MPLRCAGTATAEYPTRDKLEAKLRAAIAESEGFGLM